MSFSFQRLSIPDVILIKPEIFIDKRGFLMESYKYSEFKKIGIKHSFVQENHSRSKKGVLRGLHYQLKPMEQAKLLRCVRGKIWDVVVDIRKNSPWYGKWTAVELSEENKFILWVPPGFAHGFVTLEDDTEVIYKVTKEYSPELDRGIIWNDPYIGIKWPIENPILSEKDTKLPILKDAENNFLYMGKV